MGIFVVHILEYFVKDKSHHNGKHKKQDRVDEHGCRLGFRILKPNHKGKHDNADDVVNDCRTQDGCTDLAL